MCMFLAVGVSGAFNVQPVSSVSQVQSAGVQGKCVYVFISLCIVFLLYFLMSHVFLFICF